MPSVSAKQKRFMGVVEGIKHGTTKGSPAAQRAAKSMSKSQVDDFVKSPVQKKR